MAEIHYTSYRQHHTHTEDPNEETKLEREPSLLNCFAPSIYHSATMNALYPSSPATAALEAEEPEHLSMEESHAELLAGYHEVSKGLLERDDGERDQDASETEPSSLEDSQPISACDAPGGSKLSETPNTLAGEFQLSLLAANRRAVGVFPRTSSVDRRLDEVAQFCEAVGQIDLQEIIEDDNSSSDDDDDTEIILDDTEVKNQSLQPWPLHKNENTRKPISPHNRRKVLPPWSFKTHEPISPLPRRKVLPTRPRWRSEKKNQSLFHSLPGEVRAHNFEYIGIQANPPTITEHGILRGNYSQLHRKAWLEVSDKKHRYGKNLRLYYRHWESLGFPGNKFFEWLDSEGVAEGQPKPEIEDCPRSELDSDTVLYINDVDVTNEYALSIEPDELGRGCIFDVEGEPIQTGPDGWIFVLRDNVMYGARKVTSHSGNFKERFHHSSFFGGKAVSAAGILITDDDGFLTRLFPHSGHYRPGDADMQRMLLYLHNGSVDLRTFEVDMQQLIHVCRQETQKNGKVKGEKKKKKDSLHLKPAVVMAHYLSHKARFIGVFSKIHLLRDCNTVSVTESLDAIDNGGYWKNL